MTYLIARAGKTRRADLRHRAEIMGYQVKGGTTPGLDLTDFPLFQGRPISVRNVMQREGQPGRLLFEYALGNAREAQWTTAALFVGRPGFPQFDLRPEGLSDKLFGGEDIDFDAHPAFSKAYRLRGADPAAVRRLFRPEVLQWFERQEGWTVQAVGDRVVVSRHRRSRPEDFLDIEQTCLPASELPRFDAEVSRMLELLVPAA